MQQVPELTSEPSLASDCTNYSKAPDLDGSGAFVWSGDIVSIDAGEDGALGRQGDTGKKITRIDELLPWRYAEPEA